jgi:serine O-acetyltransferase
LRNLNREASALTSDVPTQKTSSSRTTKVFISHPHGDEANGAADPVWDALCEEARVEEQRGSTLNHYLTMMVLDPPTLEDALAGILSSKLATDFLVADKLKTFFQQAFASSKLIQSAIRRDLQAVADRDPVAGGVFWRCSFRIVAPKFSALISIRRLASATEF